MKNINFLFSNILKIVCSLSLLLLINGCEDSFEFVLPEENSQTDTELPNADFAVVQDVVDFKLHQFQGLDLEATNFDWDFGDGGTAAVQDPLYSFEGGEGTYSVTLTTSDANGASSTITKDVVVIEPEPPAVLDPVIVNGDFNKLDKNAGSACCCAAWINKDLGEQGESSSGNGGTDNVIKFDNAEPDHAYQEFAVVPNADYKVTIVTSFKGLETGVYPSRLEMRILAGTGYVAGYTPVYYMETTEFPQEGWGYTSLAQAEDAANNLAIEVLDNPSDDSYISEDFTFNSGANTSVALFIRGIGNADPPEDPADFALYQYCGGEEEIRAEYVIIEAVE